jgi:hypothetical protein
MSGNYKKDSLILNDKVRLRAQADTLLICAKENITDPKMVLIIQNAVLHGASIAGDELSKMLYGG